MDTLYSNGDDSILYDSMVIFSSYRGDREENGFGLGEVAEPEAQ